MSTAQVIGARMNDCDDNDGQMIFGDPGGLKFPDICLTGEEKHRKNLTQETCPDGGSNPGPLRDRRVCCRLAHSGGRNETETQQLLHIKSVQHGKHFWTSHASTQ